MPQHHMNLAQLPDHLKGSQAHMDYFNKVAAEKYDDFTEEEFAHFCCINPQHAFVLLGVCNKYGVAKRVHTIKDQLLGNNPGWHSIRPKQFQ